MSKTTITPGHSFEAAPPPGLVETKRTLEFFLPLDELSDNFTISETFQPCPMLGALVKDLELEIDTGNTGIHVYKAAPIAKGALRCLAIERNPPLGKAPFAYMRLTLDIWYAAPGIHNFYEVTKALSDIEVMVGIPPYYTSMPARFVPVVNYFE